MDEEFKIKIEGFEGPLDLLLSLIEKRKLPINDVSLAAVTDEYIQFIERQKDFPLSQASHFVLIASTLLLIKSKSLLPTLNLTEEEEEDIEKLEERLKLYKRTKELSVHISERFGKRVLLSAQDSKSFEPVFSPPQDATLASLGEAVAHVIAALPKVKAVPEAIVKKVVSLEEMIDNLTDRVTKNLRMSFFDFSKAGKSIDKEEKVEVIVGFLALLELVKQGIINATQENKFSDITMETDTVGIPKYE
ncbi:MAG: segregation/condensation protein A [Candidatus Pacebacteria bacterium]|nr:segregation/condensation protein A [Candidatus Paceibacterota bacterium]